MIKPRQPGFSNSQRFSGPPLARAVSPRADPGVSLDPTALAQLPACVMNGSSSARIGLLAFLWLGAPGCKEVPLNNDPDAVAAPSFGLNSVPRQWEPDLEEGDTTVRGTTKIAAEFEDKEADTQAALAEVSDEAEASAEEAAGEAEKPTARTTPKPAAKSAQKRTPAKVVGAKEAQTLPEADKAAQKELDDDFGPG